MTNAASGMVTHCALEKEKEKTKTRAVNILFILVVFYKVSFQETYTQYATEKVEFIFIPSPISSPNIRLQNVYEQNKLLELIRLHLYLFSLKEL